jgi:cytochrome c oxidase assembly protein subunit 11
MTDSKSPANSSRKIDPNKCVLIVLLIGVLVMIGAAYAAVPLYSLFCRTTGFDGTTQRADSAPQKIAVSAKDRYVTVTFDGNVDSAVPWEFGPDVKTVRVKVGEPITIKYHALNHGAQTTTATATYNVQPDRAGAYFDKIQCFCFTKQTLKPGEKAEFPVQFFIDPAIKDDPQNDDIANITLSYTFFLDKNPQKPLATEASARSDSPADPPFTRTKASAP